MRQPKLNIAQGTPVSVSSKKKTSTESYYLNERKILQNIFTYAFCFKWEQLIQWDYSFCFKGKQLERSKAKQWKTKCIKENSGIRVAMCTLFKKYIYNLNHHNHLQHSSPENIFTKGNCTKGTHAGACNHDCHTPNFPTSWLMLLIDIQNATQERERPDQYLLQQGSVLHQGSRRNWNCGDEDPLVSNKTLIMAKISSVVRDSQQPSPALSDVQAERRSPTAIMLLQNQPCSRQKFFGKN